MKWRYTNIQHAARIALGLTPNEYCVADIIYKSQTHPDFTRDGWTEIGCHKLAEFLGFSSGTVHKMLDRFETWGMLEFNEDKNKKRMTASWYNIAYLDEEGVQKVSVQKVNRGRSKSERKGVQKVNEDRSKSEHINKERKSKTKLKEKGAPQNGKINKPTLEEVEAYFKQLYSEKIWRPRFAETPEATAQSYYDHYESNGWKIGGKAPMKKFKAACHNWLKNNERFGRVPTTAPSQIKVVHKKEKEIVRASAEAAERALQFAGI